MKKYYAGYNPFGTDYEYAERHWDFYEFDSKKDRDEYVEKNWYDQSTGNRVCAAVYRRDIPERALKKIEREKEAKLYAQSLIEKDGMKPGDDGYDELMYIYREEYLERHKH